MNGVDFSHTNRKARKGGAEHKPLVGYYHACPVLPKFE